MQFTIDIDTDMDIASVWRVATGQGNQELDLVPWHLRKQNGECRKPGSFGMLKNVKQKTVM
jgi:hypothetical protein